MSPGIRYPLASVAVLMIVAACSESPLSTGTVSDVGRPTLATAAAATAASLGQSIFHDRALSVNGNQSCASCHEPSEGFSAPATGVVTRGSVVQGSVPGEFGDRKPPSSAYATIAPRFSGGRNPVGGNFWDGRATGNVLGNPAADQAMGPFLNPKEQALPDKACVLYRIRFGAYYADYTAVHGPALGTVSFPANADIACRTVGGGALALTSTHRAIVDAEYENVARSIAAFEATTNRYASRLDGGQLTAQEQQGAKLFSGKGKCHTCHTAKGTRAPFTDFAFHNLGVPKNPENPVYHYATTAFDPGLGGFTENSVHIGKFKTPTARNVGMGSNRTFMHNGVLTTLEQVVDFYSTRDVLPRCSDAIARTVPMLHYGSIALGGIGCWPAPEFARNLDSKNMGNLGLTVTEVRVIVAFMRALDDQP